MLLFCVDILINNSENNNYEKDLNHIISEILLLMKNSPEGVHFFLRQEWITRERNMRQTIISHRNCIFNDEYTNDYSILSGESGTILTLINGIYLGKEYPKLLMID